MIFTITIDDDLLQKAVVRDINKSLDPSGYGNGTPLRERVKVLVAEQLAAVLSETDIKPLIVAEVHRSIQAVTRDIVERQTRRIIRATVNREVELLKAGEKEA